MKNELEKCLAGEWYDCHNPIFLEYKDTAGHLLKKYNALEYNQKKEKTSQIKSMLERKKTLVKGLKGKKKSNETLIEIRV
ncbi:MAG: hypothetical protein HDQ98_15440 [Lachnospiraceae bacterium]|nr:hypothetical protein [Lachnospiraceae bacterium]